MEKNIVCEIKRRKFTNLIYGNNKLEKNIYDKILRANWKRLKLFIRSKYERFSQHIFIKDVKILYGFCCVIEFLFFNFVLENKVATWK